MTELMVLPQCKTHGQMMLRETNRQSYEQKWCGVWYACSQCTNSTLLPSKELLEQNKALAKAESKQNELH